MGQACGRCARRRRQQKKKDEPVESALGDCVESFNTLVSVLREPPDDVGPQSEKILRDLRGLLRDVRPALYRCLQAMDHPDPKKKALAQWAAKWSRRPRPKALRPWFLRCRRRGGTSSQRAPLNVSVRSFPEAPAPRQSEVQLPDYLVEGQGPECNIVIEPVINGEPWKCDNAVEEAFGIAAPWRSAPGLPTPMLTLRSGVDEEAALDLHAVASGCSKFAHAAAVQNIDVGDASDRERQGQILVIRRLLHSLSDRSRHLHTKPLPTHEQRSRPGTFRELFCQEAGNVCSMDEVIINEIKQRDRQNAPININQRNTILVDAGGVAPAPEGVAPALEKKPPVSEPKYDGDDLTQDDIYVAVKHASGQISWYPASERPAH